MTKKYSEFCVWFEEQHEKRPSKKPLNELKMDMSNKIYVAENAIRLVKSCELWDAKQTSALHAWQAAKSKSYNR